ncbi:MAG: transcription termination/antitermination protein NusG [Candidatus Campbellbacteria bacterium]|nr:transcription termination/antitermination protein NusG [Candidatus Campbellbacteria bacterium]
MSKQTSTGEKNWYAVHTYSGYEESVMRNLKQRVVTLGMENRIFDVIVPTEKCVKIKGGKRTEVTEKIYPGYVLVNMIVDDETWYTVRNTPRVTGFVGVGTSPVPLSEEESKKIFSRMEQTTPMYETDFTEGDMVVVIDGPFKDLEGRIGSVNHEEGKVKVYVPMFGRETGIELDFLQIRRV